MPPQNLVPIEDIIIDGGVVYRFYDINHNLLYIGSSLNNPIVRIYQHKKNQPWFSEIKYYSVVYFSTIELARKQEELAIASENPKYNFASVCLRKAREKDWLKRGQELERIALAYIESFRIGQENKQINIKSIPEITIPDLLTTSQVAKLFGVDSSTVRRWLKDQKISAIRMGGGHPRYRRDDIERVLEISKLRQGN